MSTFHTTIERESLMFHLIFGLNAPDLDPHFSGFEDSSCLKECLLKPVFALKLMQSESVTAKLPRKLLLHLCDRANSMDLKLFRLQLKSTATAI